MRPSGLTIKPEPIPVMARAEPSGDACDFGVTCLAKARRGSSASIAAGAGPDDDCSEVAALIFTTAGPYRSTMVGKSTDAEALAGETRFSFTGGGATAAAFDVGGRHR